VALSSPHVTLLPRRRKLVYAGFGFVDVVLDAMRIILQSPAEQFRYINVMSGQDYPIKNTIAFAEHLRESYPAEYFQVADMRAWPQGLSRFQRFYLTDWSIRGRRKLEKVINLFVRQREFFPGLVPYGRSSWFTCTDRCARHCVRFADETAAFTRFMKTVWSPDEFYFNTLVMNSPLRQYVVANNLRHIEFLAGKVSPEIFTAQRLDELVESDRFLARKFDIDVDEKVLDLLDAAAS
jgi:hypothetical protein